MARTTSSKTEPPRDPPSEPGSAAESAGTLRRVTLVGAPLLGLAMAAVCHAGGLPQPAAVTAGITTWVALWWVFEPIQIPATSLIPFAAFPLFGVLDHEDVATAYGHHLILLLLGGFLLSTAMEKSGAHRRLALGMVRLVGGTSGRRIVLGFMLASSVLSMWISNTATTLMLLPVALAVLDQVEANDRAALGVPLLLGVAYAANVGGVGTPVGTPPNVIFLANYEEVTGTPWSFLGWMAIGVPVVVLFVPLIWWWLTRRLKLATEVRMPDSGAWRIEERRVLIVFGLTALLWITRTEPFGGWNGWLELLWQVDSTGGKTLVGDSSVALAMVVVMFLVPNGKGRALLDWESAVRVPWGLLLLFGGGMAIGKAFAASGLSAALGALLQGLTAWPVVGMIAMLCLAVTFLTEVTSNTATTNILMPVLAASAAAAAVEPALLMAPAAISASCAFMLPVATAPNAIVFGTGELSTRTMARVGIALNLIGAAVITAVCVIQLG